MKSILMVTTIPDTLQAFLLPIAYHFRSQGWRVDAMACKISSNAQCLQIFDNVWNVEWSRNPLEPQNLILTPRTIQQVVQQEKYDIVHVHTPVAAFVTRYALRNKHLFPHKPKVIYTAHGFHFYRGGKPLKNALFLNLEKLAGRWTDYLVVINREDEEAAKHKKLVSPERISYMPGIGVNLEEYSSDCISSSEVIQVREELGLTPQTQMLLCVAELIPRKRPQDVLKAFAHLNKSNTFLAFAGNGPLLYDMQQLAKELNVANKVRFLGFRKDIPILISAAAATVIASEQEGLPRCVMESMSLGIPVIGTAIRGTQDLLKDGCGFLVKVGDVKSLANAMAYVLNNPLEARITGQRARERMTQYDLSHIIKLHSALYAQAVSTKIGA
ncbi:putative group 1 glycosyl transferase [Calothrix sp. NIES-4071]|nr:putative group 1 glycosyl transferase [Calothrix sp. NIES-4071]BAZ58967.1 putative group 1 glycosyl transferase [Calothrix sp. NIES-4105]